jgi:hypothetical protein
MLLYKDNYSDLLRSQIKDFLHCCLLLLNHDHKISLVFFGEIKNNLIFLIKLAKQITQNKQDPRANALSSCL